MINLKNIALDLLKEYEASSLTVVWEYSMWTDQTEQEVIDECNEIRKQIEDSTLSEDELNNISKVYQSYYGMSIDEIAAEDDTARKIFVKVGLIDD
jgi:hypothetical protein